VLDDALRAELEAEFDEVTATAQAMVVAATGLQPPTGRARAAVVDRPAWVRANLASSRRLLEPVLERTARPSWSGSLRLGSLQTAGATVTGAQIGAVLGWMSSRVLGQYDVFPFDDDRGHPSDIVTYVGPNVVALERRYGFPPRQFRLWVALHEVTHWCQFAGVPWMSDYFRSLVEAVVEALAPDPRRLSESLRRAARALWAGRDPLADGGLLGLVLSPEQRVAMERIQALMSLLEGHGEVIMGEAGGDVVPEADRFARVIHERRHQASPPVLFLQRLLGFEAKLRQYEEGAQFVRAAESVGGRALFDRVWEQAGHLPTVEEIRRPELWVQRLGAVAVPG
jgi:coenzyme F420 biosynthesis associated uncharacterized protein